MIRINRIGREKDFQLLFLKGRRRESRFFRLTVLPNTLTFSRFAFIASKNVDKRAVVRNRLRRRSREWMRKNLISFPRGLDIALFFKKDAKNAVKKEFYEDLAKLFENITVF